MLFSLFPITSSILGINALPSTLFSNIRLRSSLNVNDQVMEPMGTIKQYGCTTRAAPKVMHPIYLHGNYNRYKEHNNTI